MNLDLQKMISQAYEAYSRMSPEQKKEHDEAQRRSWVIGNLMLSNPSMTQERAEKLYEENVR